MTFSTIPLDSLFNWFSFSITLSGISYTLRFRYNTRSTRWVMDIADASGNDILDGVTLLINTDLTYNYRTALPKLPVGQFFVVDNTGNNKQPTQFSFGVTHSLIYGDPNG